MPVADAFALENRFDSMPTQTIDDLLQRLRQVRRRIERWVPSSKTIALWSNDYAEVFDAAVRLEATVGELDTRLGTCGNDPENSPVALKPILDVLEARAGEFEEAIIRTSSVA